MEALLVKENSSNEEYHDLRTSLCYYLSIILVLVAFILSMFSLGFCSAVVFRIRCHAKTTIQNKLYT